MKYLKRNMSYEIPLLGRLLFWRDYRRAENKISGWYGDDPHVVLAAMGCAKAPTWFVPDYLEVR
jgi:hypothetical protein